MAVNKFQSGGVDLNWGTTGNWSQGTVPTANDGHVTTFDATSPNCTVNTSSRVANTLDFTGYTGTITMTNQITVSGSITLASGMTISGSGALLANATATLTSNGKTWPNALTLTGGGTYTLADNWVVSGLLTLGATTSTTTINSNQITASAGLTLGGTSATVAGSTLILLNGTGTITPASSGVFQLPLTINTAGTITYSATTHRYNTGTLTYVAGTVVTTGSTLLIVSAATTLACNGIVWDKISFTGTVTVTLSENLNLTGLFSLGSSGTVTTNGHTINLGSGLRYQATSNSAGTTVFNVRDTCTLDSVAAGVMSNPLVINASGKTITVTSAFNCDLGKVTYTAGTVVPSGGTQWSTGGGGSGTVFSSPLIQGVA